MPLLKLPEHFKSLYKGVIDSLRAGNISIAAKGAVQLVEDCPDFDGGWLLLSQIAQAEKNIPFAVRAVTQAISRNPENILHYVQLGRCLSSIGKTEDTLKILDKIAGIRAETAEEHDAVATLMMGCNMYDEAMEYAEKAICLAPDKTLYKLTAAIIALTIGDLQRSGQCYREILKEKPDHQAALAGLARLETATGSANLIDALQGQLNCEIPLSVDREVRLRYALAKHYEDVEDHSKSFKELQKAATLHRQTLDYTVKDDIALVDELIEQFPDESAFVRCQIKSDADSDAPIFIIGMPRSGTTLVERIITAHPSVTSAGELHDFGIAAVSVAGRQKPGKYIDVDFARSLKGVDMSAIGKAYLEQTRRFYQDRPHFVDKLPMNVLYAGYIRKALPNAKIIELVRHPFDVCFSNFKLLFKSGYEYSYDLEELAHFYLAYRRLADHWKHIMGRGYLSVHYEDVVSDQEQQSRRLIEFCGLEWHDDCLDFHKNTQASATASSAQVRQPIYTKAVARWKYYEKELAPLINILGDKGQYF